MILDSPEWVCPSGTRIVVPCRCTCGIEVEKNLNYMVVGDTTSCGECAWKMKDEWFSGKYNKLSIVAPADSQHNKDLYDELPDRFGVGVGGNGSGSGKRYKVVVQCDCGKTNTTILGDLLGLRTLSCGCALNDNFSRASDTLGDFLTTLDIGFIKSDRREIQPRELDFWCSTKRVGIEYHGNHWHSEARRSYSDRLKDYEKYVMCRTAGIDLVQVYSDEWDLKRLIFEDMLRKRVGVISGMHRLYNLTVKGITLLEANQFLIVNHYLGETRAASIIMGLFRREELVGVATVRRLKDSLECTRFAMLLGTRSYHPFRKVLDYLQNEFKTGVLISFSDNRLHTGKSYSDLGFRLLSTLPPDYCYTNGKHRKHKFLFRVPAGTNEALAAAARGFYRLWDSGKKKWELRW